MKLVEQETSEKFIGLKTEQEERIKLVNRDQIDNNLQKKEENTIGEKK